MMRCYFLRRLNIFTELNYIFKMVNASGVLSRCCNAHLIALSARSPVCLLLFALLSGHFLTLFMLKSKSFYLISKDLCPSCQVCRFMCLSFSLITDWIFARCLKGMGHFVTFLHPPTHEKTPAGLTQHTVLGLRFLASTLPMLAHTLCQTCASCHMG